MNRYCGDMPGGGSALKGPSSLFKTRIFEVPKLEARRQVREGWVRRRHEDEGSGLGPLG